MSAAPKPPRRVVAAPGPTGAGVLTADGAPPLLFESDRYRVWAIWGSDSRPALGEYDLPFAATAIPTGEGIRVTVADILPGERSRIPAGMHETATIDFAFVISARVHLVESGGEEVVLEQGDTIVQAGSGHSWHNPGPGPARLGFVLLATSPAE